VSAANEIYDLAGPRRGAGLQLGLRQGDWIERTLVTVDVSGSWYGTIRGSLASTQQVWLDLRQEGAKVSGSILFKPDQSTNSSGPIEGAISGDILRYKLVRGSSYVELTVNGDEMNGVTAGRVISLQRNASAPR
jgi:hypothetical protein